MKKVILLFLCSIFLLFYSSCGLFGPQEYKCAVEEVVLIQIVRLNQYVEEEYRFEYTILSQISDYKTFVKQLNDLDYSVNWGDPRTMENGYIVIRIEYRNGDFDLIHQDAQWFNRSGRNQNGYFFFDDEQFNSLVSNYVVK
jgi:hypothetical protein